MGDTLSPRRLLGRMGNASSVTVGRSRVKFPECPRGGSGLGGGSEASFRLEVVVGALLDYLAFHH